MKKHKVKCDDGPLAGEILYLVSPTTAIFTLKETTGRYVPVGLGENNVKWEPHHASRA